MRTAFVATYYWYSNLSRNSTFTSLSMYCLPSNCTDKGHTPWCCTDQESSLNPSRQSSLFGRNWWQRAVFVSAISAVISWWARTLRLRLLVQFMRMGSKWIASMIFSIFSCWLWFNWTSSGILNSVLISSRSIHPLCRLKCIIVTIRTSKVAICRKFWTSSRRSVPSVGMCCGPEHQSWYHLSCLFIVTHKQGLQLDCRSRVVIPMQKGVG
jgi:hypothetical protein